MTEHSSVSLDTVDHYIVNMAVLDTGIVGYIETDYATLG